MCVPADGAVRYLPYEQRSLQSRDSKRGRKTGGGEEGREKKGERRKERGGVRRREADGEKRKERGVHGDYFRYCGVRAAAAEKSRAAVSE